MNYILSMVTRQARLFTIVLTGLFLATGFHCVLNPPEEASSSGGTGSEIIGTAAYDSGAAAKRRGAGAVNAVTMIPVVAGNVFCYQRFAVPDTNWARSAAPPRVRTDDDGGFVIEDAPPGEVVVEVGDGQGNSYATTVNVDRDSAKYRVGVLPVKKTGALTIKALTNLPGRVRFYVGVKGTRLVVRGSQAGVEVRLDNVPCGMAHTVSIRVYEPISFSMDISDVAVSSAVTKALGTFQIK